MARLKVLKNQTLIQELNLDPGQTYLAGRGDSCQIKLDAEPGISRQHFQISNVDGQWKLEVLSRYGELYVENEKASGAELTDNFSFSIPPYDFQFGEGSIGSAPEGFSQSSDERTVVSVLPSSAHLRLVDNKGKIRQVFRLEGETWLAGRDVTCALFIDNPKVSRKQFELYRDGATYFIRDLGSSNGTLVNGHPISKEEWAQLQSGDAISVIDWVLYFELRDSLFHERVESVEPAYKTPPFMGDHNSVDPQEDGMLPTQYGPIPTDSNQFQAPMVQSQQPPATWNTYLQPQQQPPSNQPPPPPPSPYGAAVHNFKNIIQRWKLTPVRLAIIGVVLVGGLYFAIDSSNSNNSANSGRTTKKEKSQFDKLSLEDQQLVKQMYSKIQQYLHDNDYQLALQEITRIRNKVPFYSDIDDLEKSANQGLALKEQEDKEKKMIQEKEDIEEKIQKQVAACRTQLNPIRKFKKTEVEACLSSVISLNPDHPSIRALLEEAEQIEVEKQVEIAKKIEARDDSKKLNALYLRAHNLKKKGLDRQAVFAYDTVVQSKLIDTKGIKAKAHAERKTLLLEMAKEQTELEKKSDQFIKDNKYKDAILALQKAQLINPDNEVIKGKLSTSLVELRKQMQGIYQEAILEESVGDVESAKAKWKKIMDQSVPVEEYYDKARIKLKKYGAI